MKFVVVLALVGLAATANVNVALDGSASQSSEGWGGSASRAIDGNSAAKWNQRSCTHSKYNTNNWWSVELEGSLWTQYPVSGVTIVNREDCCQNRINGAQVFVGDTLCGSVTYVAGQGTYNVECTSAINGSSVTVKQANDYLTLCEVMVWVAEEDLPDEDDAPAYTNVALKGSASASSYGWNGVASRGVDGKTSGRWGDNSCTHSKYDKDNWWKVDLEGSDFGAEYPVSMVVIYNRQDCCQDRINGAKVYVGEELCGTITYSGKAAYKVQCGTKLAGGSVTVKQASNYLTLCEVEIYVADEDLPDIPAVTNVALKGSASASSYGWNGFASRGVDGKTSGRWGDNSCTHSKYNKDNWWKVDLEGAESGVAYPVSMVIIYNRQDCCQDRINGTKVYVGEELCGTITYAAGQAAYKVHCSSTLSAGTVTVKQASNYLTLCEVEIYVADDALPRLSFYNAALGVATTETTTGWGGVSGRAVDGNTNGRWAGASCTHTRGTGQSWTATLPESVEVDHVLIYNRLDCCQNRINGAEVWIGSTKCGSVTYTNAEQAMYKVQCPAGSVGSSVKVKAASNQYLTLCEVKIMVATEEMGTEEMDEEEE